AVALGLRPGFGALGQQIVILSEAQEGLARFRGRALVCHGPQLLGAHAPAPRVVQGAHALLPSLSGGSERDLSCEGHRCSQPPTPGDAVVGDEKHSNTPLATCNPAGTAISSRVRKSL